MATIGLKVQDSPFGGDLKLADLLSKSIFGDPEGQMKARLMASQVGAHQAYREKLLADAGLVSEHLTEDQRAEAERLRAGPLIGDAAAAAVPQPVEVSRASVPENTRYGPQIVDPASLKTHDALVAREHALGPILARSKPEDIGKAVGTDYGGTILAGAAANPAIVNPDSLRLASTLYTGSAPTTSTVMTSGDYAGVDAAARGKILEERAKPPAIITYRDQPGHEARDANGNPIFQPLGGTQATPVKPNVSDVNGVHVETVVGPDGRAQDIPVPGAPVKPPEIKNIEVGGLHYQTIVDQQTGRETAYLIPGQPPPVQKPNTFQGPDNTTYLPVPDPTAPGGFRAVKMAGVDAPLPPATAVDPSKPLMTRDAAGLHPVAGMPAAPAPSASIYDQGLTPVAADNKFVGEVAMKVYAGQPVNRDQALQYAQSWNNLYAAKYQIEIINGARSLIPVEPEKPSPYPKPEIVLSKAGVDQTIIDAATKPVVVEPQTPVQTGGTAPVQTTGGPTPTPAPTPTPTGPTVIPLEAPKKTPLTKEQGDAQSFASAAALAETRLSSMGVKNIPGDFQYVLGTNTSPGFLMTVAKSAFENPSTRDWANSMWQFTNAINRKESGAAITDEEWATARQLYIPVPGDGPKQIADKRINRINKLKSLITEGWSPDPDGGSKFVNDWTRKGVDFGVQPPDKPLPGNKSSAPPSGGNPASKFFR